MTPRYSGGNNPSPVLAPSEDYSDKAVFDPADGQEPLLAVLHLGGWDFKDRPLPDFLGSLKIDSM
jgi:hypothetical protein